MRRRLIETIEFLFVLSVLQLARLLVVVFCIGEILIVIALWGVAVAQWQKDYDGIWFLMPIGMMVFIIIQVAVWQFTWLRLAQRSDYWRALAEVFSRAGRYPVVRPPHSWE